MPTEKRPWPDAVLPEYRELLSITDRLKYLFLSGQNYPQINTAELATPDIKSLIKIIRQLNEKKQKFYECGEFDRWPRWVIWGIEDAVFYIEDIKELLAFLSAIQGGPYISLQKEYQQNILTLVEKIHRWLTEKWYDRGLHGSDSGPVEVIK